jgi:DNA-directed RNA polymerase subunit RPC12/RpoP
MIEADRKRASHLRNKFGISLEQYSELLKGQKCRCAICEKHYTEFATRLAVDHNHITGEIRGLLCNYCNRRIVGRHRDSGLLRKVADYLDKGTGLFVPKRRRPVKRKPKKNE